MASGQAGNMLGQDSVVVDAKQVESREHCRVALRCVELSWLVRGSARWTKDIEKKGSIIGEEIRRLRLIVLVLLVRICPWHGYCAWFEEIIDTYVLLMQDRHHRNDLFGTKDVKKRSSECDATINGEPNETNSQSKEQKDKEPRCNWDSIQLGPWIFYCKGTKRRKELTWQNVGQ